MADDIYICGVYLWSDDSPASRVIDANLFDIVLQDILHFEQRGIVLIAGDFNARIGKKPDYIVCDSNVSDLDFNLYNPDHPLTRASLDHVCNARGNRLLELCKASSYRVVNGRLGSDCGTGGFTYYSTQACTTIDYLLSKECDFYMVNDFSIKEFNMYSDHAPLQFAIKCRSAVHDCANNRPKITVVKWNAEHRDLFRRGIIGKLPHLNEVIGIGNCNNANSIDLMIQKFSDEINDVASPLFKRNINPNKHYLQNKWFDNECYNAKKVYLEALNTFNRVKTDDNRQQLCSRKLDYKRLVRKKKRTYKLKQAAELETLKKVNLGIL